MKIILIWHVAGPGGSHGSHNHAQEKDNDTTKWIHTSLISIKLLLAQGKTQGLAPRAHQQALTTGPFDNTYEEDAVSPEAVMRGLQDKRCLQPKGRSSGSNKRTTQHSYITYQLRSILHIYLSNLT
jgi:hypothetical protein